MKIFIRDYFYIQCCLWLYPHPQSCTRNSELMELLPLLRHMKCIAHPLTTCFLLILWGLTGQTVDITLHQSIGTRSQSIADRWPITSTNAHIPRLTQGVNSSDTDVCTLVVGHDDESGLTGIEGHRDADAETMDGIILWLTIKFHSCQPNIQHVRK